MGVASIPWRVGQSVAGFHLPRESVEHLEMFEVVLLMKMPGDLRSSSCHKMFNWVLEQTHP